MTFDLVFQNARIAGSEDRTVDIGIRGGRFAAIEAKLPEADAPTQDLAGRIATCREGVLVSPEGTQVAWVAPTVHVMPQVPSARAITSSAVGS